MGKTVFILGAGASFKAGVPLMSNFLDVAQDLLTSGIISAEDKVHFERVFKGISTLQSVHSKSKLDLNNLESVFATFEMAKRLDKMPGFNSEEIPLLIDSMKRLIVVTIERTLKFPVDNPKVLPPVPYGKFGELIQSMKTKLTPKEDVSILTFNYDIAADLMLHFNELGPDYCLKNSNNFGKKDVVKLLKLHGSINWGTIEEIDRIRPLHINEYLRPKRFTHGPVYLNIGSELSQYTDFNFQKEPVIIPPTWNKSNFPDDLLDVWRQAAKELEEADSLIIIGFSLPETDIFFRHLYALGTVGEVPLKRFWVFDPQERGGIVETRYRSLLGPGANSRFKYHDITFEEAINVIENEYLR